MSRIFLLLVAGLTPTFAQLPDGLINTQKEGEEPPTPAESLAAIQVPEGFRISLYAAEPNVAQPIAINYDDRGRLWVAESFSYIEWKRNGKDRILIFEDLDRDGVFDKRTVFWDRGNHVSGFQVGFGGVWICDAPQLLFIPDRDRDDVPDGEPEVILDGWSTEAEHNFFNGLTWGPDGWLYGRHGIKRPSLVGKPGTPDADRTPLSCSIWRYHPVRGDFEVYAEGTINPWGLDWNADGQAFITTSVVDHFWHLVPGARFSRWDNQGTSIHPHAYDLMKPTSDHRHWHGGETERRQAGGHDHEGGGHSHCGLVIYQSDAWPERYRGKAILGNVLGQRLNMEHLSRHRSGYVARHGDDFLKSSSPWFRATDLKQGPFGELMVAEWTDFGECHDRDGIHRTSGRIYQVSYGDSTPSSDAFDVAALSNDDLVNLLDHENVWWRRRALRNLYERGEGDDALIQRLLKKQAIDALQAIDPGGDWIEKLYRGADQDTTRAKLIGLRFIDGIEPRPEHVQWLETQAALETAPLVHLWMTAALQRIPDSNRWKLAERLAAIHVPEADRNLILMRWYGIEPLVENDPKRAVALALNDGHAYLSQSIARRAVSADALDIVLSGLHDRIDSQATGPILEGLLAALPSKVEAPGDWTELSPVLRSHSDESVRASAFRLAHRFGDPAAETEMVELVRNPETPIGERREFLRLLMSTQSEKLRPAISALIEDPALGPDAVRAVAVFPEPQSADQLIEKLATANAVLAIAIVETLAARSDFADTLVGALAEERIARDQIPAYVARQIASSTTRKDEFSRIWPLNAADLKKKEAELAKWKKRLPESELARADPAEGRRVYQRLCASCHLLYGEGQSIGPDLTGSNRANLDYFLINVLFPSEDVSEAYKLVTLTLKDGRVLVGNVVAENEQVLTLRQVTQEDRISVSDIVSRKKADLSLMPPGLIDPLNRNDVRDLIGYLRTTQPLAEGGQ